MSALSKTKKIELLAKLVQKRSRGAGLSAPPRRTVLEHILYAALLENASFEQADAAFAVLESYFIDWNEVRVSTVHELADTFPMLPNPQAAAERVRKSLQGIFEKMYKFDLEELLKKGRSLTQNIDFLEAIPAGTPFMISYTAQAAFDGHVIPLDEASLRILRLLGLTQVNKENTREDGAGLERAIPKKNGTTFAAQLHHFAIAFYDDPDSAELMPLLKGIDPDAVKRSWTPPALIVPKVWAKPLPPLVIPPLPAVAIVDDDDFEEEAGTEAEFLPEEIPYLEPPKEAASKKQPPKQTEVKATPKPTPKPAAVKPEVKPEVKPTVKQEIKKPVVSSAKPEPVKKPVPKPPVKKAVPVKPAAKPTSKPVTQPAAKPVVKKPLPPKETKSMSKPAAGKSAAKPQPKKPFKTVQAKPAAKKGAKTSPSKELRKKKPK